VLAKAGLGAGAIDRESYQLALSVIALSLIVSPFWLVTARRIHSLGHTMQYTGIGPVFQRIYPNAYEWSRRGRVFALENAAALLHWLRSRR